MVLAILLSSVFPEHSLGRTFRVDFLSARTLSYSLVLWQVLQPCSWLGFQTYDAPAHNTLTSEAALGREHGWYFPFFAVTHLAVGLQG